MKFAGTRRRNQYLRRAGILVPFVVAILSALAAVSTGSPPPKVTLSATSLSFGNQLLGTTSAAKTVTLTNSGGATLTISSITVTGDFAQINTCGTSVAAGANCTISVTFTPTTTGTRSGTLSITDNAKNSPQAVALSGTGTPPVTFSPASISFGSVVVGSSSATTNVQLTNSGSSTLNITSITLTGTDTTQFALVAPTSGSPACSFGASSITAGSSCFFGVKFAPTSTGAKSASVSVADNAAGSPQTVPLSGTGTASGVTFSPTSISFGSVVVGGSSATTNVQLTNSGSSTLNITSITLTGTDATQFALVAPTSGSPCSFGASSISAGSSCFFGVKFAPTSTGAKSASVSVADDAAGSPQTVSLSGTGGSVIPPLSVLHVWNNTDNSGALSTSITVTVANAAGSALVAFVREAQNNTDNFTISDSASQTWTQTASGYEDVGFASRVGMFFKVNSAALTSVTANYTTVGGVARPLIIVLEIANAATSALEDASVKSGATSGGTSLSSGSLATTNPNDILIYCVGVGADQTSWTAGSGFTILSNNVASGA